MTRRILITPKASQDIDKLFEYIAQNNSEIEYKYLLSLLNKDKFCLIAVPRQRADRGLVSDHCIIVLFYP